MSTEPSTHSIHFRVEGRGPFPQDMLRYDECQFATDSDAVAAAHSVAHSDEIRAVTLVCRTERLTGFPTMARWASFGWEVTSCKRVRVAAQVTHEPRASGVQRVWREQ